MHHAGFHFCVAFRFEVMRHSYLRFKPKFEIQSKTKKEKKTLYANLGQIVRDDPNNPRHDVWSCARLRRQVGTTRHPLWCVCSSAWSRCPRGPARQPLSSVIDHLADTWDLRDRIVSFLIHTRSSQQTAPIARASQTPAGVGYNRHPWRIKLWLGNSSRHRVKCLCATPNAITFDCEGSKLSRVHLALSVAW
jgi:hypothetical protein